MADPDQLLTFNGINGRTGQYGVSPLTPSALRDAVRSQVFDPDHLSDLQQKRSAAQDSFAIRSGLDPNDLAQAGWAALFPPNTDPAIREALKPLLDWRREQACAKNETLFKLYADGDCYRGDKNAGQFESKQDFLRRQHASAGPVDPTRVPYYVMLVGGPDQIPFRFQYELDVAYAVGRIHFDAPEDYHNYARSVVEAEKGNVALPRRAAIFATANPQDGATNLSASNLADPLLQWWRKDPSASDDWWKKQQPWMIDGYLRDQAMKSQLASVLHGDSRAALLFTASHGMLYPSGDPLQRAMQGALLCQDWPGPAWQNEIPDSFLFSASDIAANDNVFGMIAMHFACFGGGTPQESDFWSVGSTELDTLAPVPFVAALPKRLLSHPRGGALAVIAHVERAWGYSFFWDGAGSQTEVFKSTLRCLMEGSRVGFALEPFNSRYAELSVDLTGLLADVRWKKHVDDYYLSGVWTATNDARSFTVLGDPAVKLPLAATEAEVKRPALDPIVVNTPAAPKTTTPGIAPLETAAVQYGLIDDTRAAVQNALSKIGSVLVSAFESVTKVEVATYTSDKLDAVDYVNGKFTGASLRGLTRCSLDGDTLVCVPERDGKVDDALWTIHSEMVSKALDHRMKMLQLAASAVSAFTGVKLP